MKKKFCLCIILMFVVTAMSGCSLYGEKKETEVPKPKLPEIQQGTVDHFSDANSSTKQSTVKQPTIETTDSNTTQKKKYSTEIQQGTVDHFSDANKK